MKNSLEHLLQRKKSDLRRILMADWSLAARFSLKLIQIKAPFSIACNRFQQVHREKAAAIVRAISEENELRSYDQLRRKQRRIRFLGVALFLLGIAKFALACFSAHNGAQGDAFRNGVDFGSLWCIAGAGLIQLSRVWGELAETSTASKKDIDPAL